MIAYIDSSVLVRAYLADEEGHEDARRLLADPDLARVTGTWSRIEVSGALVRASRSGRGAATKDRLLGSLDDDLGPGGPVAVVETDQAAVELAALDLVRRFALPAMDAWHLAVAGITLPTLASDDQALAFATRDDEQGAVAARLGWQRI